MPAPCSTGCDRPDAGAWVDARVGARRVGARVRAKNFSPLQRPPIPTPLPTPQYNPAIHHRRSIRLHGYDYSRAGAYFITICAHNRECLFGEIVDGKLKLNDAGHVAALCWNDIPVHFPHVDLDEFVVMPNHVHGILSIVDPDVVGAHIVGTDDGVGADVVGAKNLSPLRPPQPPPPSPSPPSRGTSKTIGSIIRGFKIGVTKWMRQNTAIHNVWQRNYWEHIIRNETELNRIREYIHHNPAQWESDKLYEQTFVPVRHEIREPGADYGLEDWMV